MTAATQARMTRSGVALPNKGTLNIAAAQTIYPGTMVGMDTAGRAVNPADGGNVPVVGVSASNATLGSSTVSADDVAVEVDYGLFGFDITGTTPLPGQMLYCVDNQTVSTDSLNGTRGKVGPCTEVRDSQAYVWIGPHTGGASSSLGTVPVTIGMSPAWQDGVANGFDPATFAFAFNPTIDDEPFLASVALPDDLDPNFDVTVRIRAAISSVATDDDVTMLCVARINGGADINPTNAAVLSVAAQDIDFTLPAANVPAAAKSLFLSIRAANTLDTHDAYLFAVEVKYTKRA